MQCIAVLSGEFVTLIFMEEIPFLYATDFQRVKLHPDKVTSLISKSMMEIVNSETKLSDQIFKKLVYILNIERKNLKCFRKCVNSLCINRYGCVI